LEATKSKGELKGIFITDGINDCAHLQFVDEIVCTGTTTLAEAQNF
jgi:hypothetical protein